jgi:hypothetical protein
MTDSTTLIDRYFRLAPQEDAEPYFAQFHPDAAAEDEGITHRGIEAIRAWRASVPPVSYEVLDTTTEGHDHVARAEISGEFPGSPVILAFTFAFTDDGLIRALAIRTQP